MDRKTKGAAMIDAEAKKLPTLYSPSEYLEKVDHLWKHGMPSGDSTNWESLDKHYTVLPGQFTVVTGWPSSGKSEFIDDLVLNLIKQDWKFAMFSFENQPVEFHITKMLEKMSGKPFGDGSLYGRIDEDEVKELTYELDRSISFCSGSSGSFSLYDVLQTSQDFLKNFPESKRGVVIDPWNELEHKRSSGSNETEYISHALSMVRNWARLNKVHVWIIAHPQKVKREGGKLPIPRPDMISGSQHWWNKADCAITVHRRHFEGDKSKEVEIHIQKVRFKHIGRIGKVVLNYDGSNGRYLDPLDNF